MQQYGQLLLINAKRGKKLFVALVKIYVYVYKERHCANKMSLKIKFVFFVLWLAVSVRAQSVDTLKCSKGRIDFGLEVQGYPAGIIPTVTSNIFLVDQLALRIRAGGNFANRRNWSPYNDNETAKGFGGSVGLVTYYPYRIGHFTAGVTFDFWNMWTNWKDNLNTSAPTQGETYTLVFQPWADIGYLFNKRNSRINYGLTFGFGKEINVVTRGERVGEGWMNSLTLTFNYTLRR
jgi:hypothetical protein